MQENAGPSLLCVWLKKRKNKMSIIVLYYLVLQGIDYFVIAVVHIL